VIWSGVLTKGGRQTVVIKLQWPLCMKNFPFPLTVPQPVPYVTQGKENKAMRLSKDVEPYFSVHRCRGIHLPDLNPLLPQHILTLTVPQTHHGLLPVPLPPHESGKPPSPP